MRKDNFKNLLFFLFLTLIATLIVNFVAFERWPEQKETASAPHPNDFSEVTGVVERPAALRREEAVKPLSHKTRRSPLSENLISPLDLTPVSNDGRPDWLSAASPATANDLQKTPEAKDANPDGAANFRRLQMQDEKGEIPIDGVQKARKQMERMRAALAKRASAAGQPNGIEVAGLEPADWAWLGPGNVGGRIRSIVIDPNNASNMWLGSAGGGIWKTTDAGVSWQPVDDFMANLAVSTLVINPVNPNIMYAGTGEAFAANLGATEGQGSPDGLRGLGVFQSTDGGATWSQLASTNPADPTVCPGGAGVACQWSYVNRLAISPDGLTILAATSTGIWWSGDAGTTWTQGAGVAGNVFDIDFDPTLSQFAVAGGQGAAAFSTDGGVNWTIANAPAIGGRVELAYAPSNPFIVYASANVNNGDIYQSTNGGQNYTRVNTGNNFFLGAGNQGGYDNIIWVNPQDPTFVVVGGIDLWRSTDCGTINPGTGQIQCNFAQISRWQCGAGQGPPCENTSAHADQHMIVAHPAFDNNTNKTVYFGNDGGIFRVDDVSSVSQTNGWTHLNHNLGITQFYGGAVTPNGVIFGGNQDNGTIRVQPTPNIVPPYDPQTWSTIAAGDGGQVAADPTDPNYLYGETQYLGLFRSTDGGNTSSNINAGITDAACTPPPGGTCVPPANFVAPFVLDPNDPNTLHAGGLSLWSCANVKAATPTWAIAKCSTAAPNPANQPISAIAVSPSNPDFIVVGHNDGQIYRTLNGTCFSDGTCTPGGACPNAPTWTRIDNLPTPPAATPPARFVTRLAIDNTKAPNWIYATFGGFANNNVFVTRDLGSTWIDVSGATGTATDLPAVPIRSIVINPAVADNLYVGTEVGIFASEDAGATWQLPQGGPANVSVDELFWYQGDLLAATHGRGVYKTHTPVIDTAKCAYEDSPSCTNPDPCPPGEIRCSAIGCGCCKAGDWSCPCSWSSGTVPTQNDDALVSCPMTGGGIGRNIRISSDLATTGLHAFGDLINSGAISAAPGFSGVSLAADRDLLNLRPSPAVTTRGVIQIPGSITAGGVVGNYGIIAVGDQLSSKGFASGPGSTLTLARASIEGDIDHNGRLEYNGVAPFQATMTLKSPAGMTSTLKGSGQWIFPRASIPSLSSFRLTGDVTFKIGEFANGGTVDVQTHTLSFGGTQFSNTWQNSSPNDRGFLGTGTVVIAPDSGNATFATNSNGTQFQFTPTLRIVSGNVNVGGGTIGPLTVDSGATMAVEMLDVNGDMNVAGSIAPLSGSATVTFNGDTFTNNGTIGNLFMIYFNRTGSPRNQTIRGVGTWSQRNAQLGLYSPSTTSLTVENGITFNSEGLTIATGSSLALGSQTLTLAGPTTLFNDGTISGFFGLVRMQASGTGGRFRSIPGAVWGAPIEIATGKVSVHPGSSTFTLTRPFQVNSGATFTMTGPAVTATGEVTNNGTINLLAGTPVATFQFLGPRFVNSGAISGGGGLIFWFGSGVSDPITRQLSGSGSWSGLAQFQVNSGSTLELLNDVTLGGNSLYSFGTINTGAYTLSLPCNVPWGGPGEAFGNIRRTDLSACSGAVTFGNPFTSIAFTSGTPPTELLFSLTLTPPAGFPGAVGRTYFITPTGGSDYTATLRLHYLDSELNGNNESALQLWRNDGTNWTPQGVTTRNTTDNWVEYTGVTAFSPWAIGTFAPTAGSVSVSGRVTTAGGRGIRNASISMTDESGLTRVVRSGSFGYYKFENVSAGQTYIVSAKSKRLRFASPTVVITVLDNVSDLDFVADQ